MKLNRNRIIEHFSEMIRIPTVSHTDNRLTDTDAFLRFRKLIRESYPVLFEVGEGWGIGDYGTLIRIPGKASDHPAVLMAHYDVVEADAADWKYEPFSATTAEGKIWGRGTLDTKCTLCSILEAASTLCASGFVPAQDIYLSFGGEEESCGETCSQIVQFLKERGVKPAFVLDEGGAVIPEGVPGVRRQAAMIGIAEKGTVNYLISLENAAGGHAAVPPKHTVIGRLSRAAVRIEEHPFPARISSSVAKMFREISVYAPGPVRAAFRHPELLGPAIKAGGTVLGGSFNAMVRSTAAVTIMEGHSSFNVLPSRAAIGVNVRLLEGDTIESARQYLEKIIDDPEIKVETVSGTEPSPSAEIDCPEWELLKEVICENWPDTIVAPYQMNGGTDSRYYSELTDKIYRFSPMVMTAEERASVHGANEAIEIEKLMKMAVFYMRLISRL